MPLASGEVYKVAKPERKSNLLFRNKDLYEHFEPPATVLSENIVSNIAYHVATYSMEGPYPCL